MADSVAKRKLLSEAKCLLFPVQWEEPFGMVMIEAMVCGTPVVTFRRGSVPEILEHGVSGFAVETQAELVDALLRVSSLDRSACRAHARRVLSIDRVARAYASVYRSVAGRRLEQAVTVS
jgi:glycosyltransferase involved in cell wall biosynthesis